MRILFLSQLLPWPLDAGPKLRAHYVLRYLAEAGHELTLLCFVRPGDSEEHLGRLRPLCRSVETVPLKRSRARDLSYGVRSLLSDTPFLIRRDQLASMQQKLGWVTRQRSFDALHVDQLWMAGYGMKRDCQGLTVLDQHNAVFAIPQRMAFQQRNPLARVLLQREAAKLEAFERRACAHFQQVVWVTEEDRQALGRANGQHFPDRVIPIATDPSSRPVVKRLSPFRVTFIGGMHWPPNAQGISWFAERVWPRVIRCVPWAVLTLIGRTSRRLLRLRSDPGIEVAGYVPDLAPYLAETAVAVVPLHSGAGMRVKILDAWCWGLPVVSTSLGASGVKFVPGENLLVADDADSLTKSVVELLRNPILARRLSENGRATAETYYDWRTLYTSWDQIYR